jgi:hypothetical protein
VAHARRNDSKIDARALFVLDSLPRGFCHKVGAMKHLCGGATVTSDVTLSRLER